MTSQFLLNESTNDGIPYMMTIRQPINNEANEDAGPSTIETGEAKTQRYAFIKLWVVDLLGLPKLGACYNFHGVNVNVVDVMGVVTDIRMFRERQIYTVDDGTGDIECVYNCGREREADARVTASIVPNDTTDDSMFTSFVEDEQTAASNEEIDKSIEVVTSWLQAKLDTLDNGERCELGSTIQGIGYLVDFRDRREVILFRMRVVRDLMEEIDHRLELAYLYQNVYSKFSGDCKEGGRPVAKKQ